MLDSIETNHLPGIPEADAPLPLPELLAMLGKVAAELQEHLPMQGELTRGRQTYINRHLGMAADALATTISNLELAQSPPAALGGGVLES